VAAQLRDHILVVALREYSRHGVDGVTLSEIAREARVSKRTLYSRFTDRDTLLVTAIEHGIERLLNPLSKAVPEGSLRDQLLYLGSEMMRISLQQDVIGLERLIYSIEQRTPDVYQRVAETIQKGRLSLIHSVLNKAVERTEIEGQSIHIATSIIFDILVTQPRREMMILTASKGEAAVSINYLEEAIDLILYGIYVRPK
jgi:AcrR family transcriptional regulator